jgi:hypothetical protein
VEAVAHKGHSRQKNIERTEIEPNAAGNTKSEIRRDPKTADVWAGNDKKKKLFCLRGLWFFTE